MRFAVATALAFAFVQVLIQGPSFAAAHCFEAREVAGNAQALKAEPYGRQAPRASGEGELFEVNFRL
ncbi:hypothetical protein PtB15_5B549 [Puccinia triticina]|nr:hypothetical protein PtB15_5B549 [Puccinia triticina]